MRLFLGLELSEECISAIKVVQQPLLSVRGVRTTYPNQLHITLKFLGEVAEQDVVTLTRALAAIKHPAFQLVLDVVGGFPTIHTPRIVFVATKESAFLTDLARKIHEATHTIPLDKPFTSHITIARVQDDVHYDFSTLAQPTHSAFFVCAFVLYRSDMRSSGVEYTVVKRFPLD